MSKKIICILHFLIVTSVLFINAQTAGDYRSVASSNWTSTSTWQYYNGTSWVAATTYPGQNTGTGNVTIIGNTDVTLNANIPNIFASLTIGNSPSLSQNNRLIIPQNAYFLLNTLLLTVNYDGTCYWSGNSKGDLVLPANANLLVPYGVHNPLPLTTYGCNNNMIIDIGAVAYAACSGGGNVLYLFSDINNAGGTLAVSTTSNAPICIGSTLNLSATASGLGSNNATIKWTGTGPSGYNYSQSPVYITNSSAKTDNVSLSSLAAGTYTFSVTVTDNLFPQYKVVKSNTVVVNPLSVGGTSSASPSSVCTNGSTQLSLSGYTGTIQWQQSPDNTTWSDIVGATSTPYTTAAITSNKYYRAKVTSGVCSTTYSTSTLVTVSTPVITSQPATTSGCVGSTVTYTVVTSTPGTTYQWQIFNGGWNNLTNDGYNYNGVTTSTLQVSNLAPYMGSYSYRAILTNNSCSITSNAAALVVNSPPVVNTTYLAQSNVCQNSTAAPFSVSATAGSGTITGYQWYSKTVGDVQSGGTLIPGATSASYTPSTSIAGTLYYYCVVTNSNGCSATAASFCGHASVIAAPVAPTASNNNPCIGNPLILTASTITNANYYSWTGPNGFTSSSQNPTVSTNATAAMAGIYSVTVTTWNGCTSLAGSTTVVVNPNVWVGSSNQYWGNGANWKYGCVPVSGTDISFLITPTPTNNLVLDNDYIVGNLTNLSSKQLIIPPGKCLTVNNSITTNNDPNQIYIQSSSSAANGSLIYHNGNGSPVYATVEMYSLATWNLSNAINNKYKWQYFGIPVTSVVASPTFDGSYVRQHNEAGTGAGSTSDNRWIQLSNSSILNPFTGYEIVQQSTNTYIFQGQLINGDINQSMSYTAGSEYPGNHIQSNPFTAAINISQINFTNMDASVYLYNTGTYLDWEGSAGSNTPGTTPGEYVVAPKFTAGVGGIPGQIPSMQGFLVIANPGGGTLNIPYSSVIVKNTDQQRTRAINNSQEKVCTRIDVFGTKFSDKMWIVSDSACSHGFDKGWDGRKVFGSSLTPQIYAAENDGDYQVNSVDDMNNTYIGFEAGEDSIYTLTFTHQNLESKYSSVYLVDSVTHTTTDITSNGSVYKFVSNPTNSITKRFKIIAGKQLANSAITPQVDNSQIKIFSSQQTIFIDNLTENTGAVSIYDIAGRIIQTTTFTAHNVTSINTSLISSGCYIIKATTKKNKVIKQVILY